jgi:hypothetical protein
VDYDLSAEDQQQKIIDEIQKSGVQLAFPFVKINEEIVVGYNPKRYAQFLELK